MSNVIKSPICKAVWTYNCHDPDRKYPDRNGVGYYSLTGSFDKESIAELEALILAEIGQSGAGTYHFKSDGTGRTDVKFKCKEKLTGRDGSIVDQKPTVIYEGKSYGDHFEQADVIISFQPRLYKAYRKTSLLLKKVEIVKLHDSETLTPDEVSEAIINDVMGAGSGEA